MLRKSFVEWVDEDGYWVRDAYDPEKEAFVGTGKLVLLGDQRRILNEALGFDDDGKLRYET